MNGFGDGAMHLAFVLATTTLTCTDDVDDGDEINLLVVALVAPSVLVVCISGSCFPSVDRLCFY